MKQDNIKTNMILTMVYKSLIYVCWFLFGISFKIFLSGKITDTKVFLLILAVMVIYLARNGLKYLYRNIALKNYNDLRIDAEKQLFTKINNLPYNKQEDTVDLANKANSLIYRYVKMIYDIGEYILPALIGLIFVFVMLVRMNIFVSLIIVGIFGFILYYRFTNMKDINADSKLEHNIFNDMVTKVNTIKVLNIKDYMLSKLDILDNVSIKLHYDEEVDYRFNTSLLIVLGLMLISVFVIVSGPINKLGYILFYIFMSLKLQRLVAVSTDAFVNIIKWNKEKCEMDLLLNNGVDTVYLDNFDTISIVDGVVSYPSGINIKIPNFVLKKNDTVSIMGKSGQGKSTIVKVLSGINELTTGKVLVDEKENSASLNVVYLSKNATLFNMSLKDNLCCGKEVSDDEVNTYLKEAGLTEWVSSLPNGLNEIINDNLSDSILVKLSLIRGIILAKDIYFLDFGSYQIDLEDEKVILNLIKKHLKKKTYIIVTYSAVLNNICRKHYFIKDHTLLESEPLL